MGKILNNLKRLGQVMTGRPIESNKIAGAIGEIADNYTGGGGDDSLTVYLTGVDSKGNAQLDTGRGVILGYVPNVRIISDDGSAINVYDFRSYYDGTAIFCNISSDEHNLYNEQIEITLTSAVIKNYSVIQ